MASDASINPWPAQEKIRAAGANGAITSIKADGTQVYGSSYAFGSGSLLRGHLRHRPDVPARSTGRMTASVTPTISRPPASDPLQRLAPARLHPGRRLARHQPARALAESRGLVLVRHRHPDEERRLRLGRQLRPARYAQRQSPSLVPELRLRLLHQLRPGRLGDRRLARRPVGRRRRRVPAGERRGPAGHRALPHAGRGAEHLRADLLDHPGHSDPDDHRGLVRRGRGQGHRSAQPGTWTTRSSPTTCCATTTPWVSWLQKAKSNFWTLPRLGFIDKDLTPGATYRYQVRDHRLDRQHPVESDLQHRHDRYRVAERLRRRGPGRRRRAPVAARGVLRQHGSGLGRLRRPHIEWRLHPWRRRRDHRRGRQVDHLRWRRRLSEPPARPSRVRTCSASRHGSAPRRPAAASSSASVTPTPARRTNYDRHIYMEPHRPDHLRRLQQRLLHGQLAELASTTASGTRPWARWARRA